MAKKVKKKPRSYSVGTNPEGSIAAKIGFGGKKTAKKVVKKKPTPKPVRKVVKKKKKKKGPSIAAQIHFGGRDWD